jgi:hypothetical protein
MIGIARSGRATDGIGKIGANLEGGHGSRTKYGRGVYMAPGVIVVIAMAGDGSMLKFIASDGKTRPLGRRRVGGDHGIPTKYLEECRGNRKRETRERKGNGRIGSCEWRLEIRDEIRSCLSLTQTALAWEGRPVEGQRVKSESRACRRGEM